jgi:outer membrane protein TolC
MKKLISIVLLGNALQFASAQPATNQVALTFGFISELAEVVRTNNSALWAVRARITAAEQNARSIPIWKNPEVMAGGMAAERGMRAEDGDIIGDIIYGIEQDLPLFGKAQAARRAAEAEIGVEQASLESQFQTLRRDLAQALFKAALADELFAIAQQDIVWLNTLADTVEQRYQAGDASQVVVLRVQN